MVFSPTRMRVALKSPVWARRRALALLTGLPLVVLAGRAALGDDLTMRAFRTMVLGVLRRRFPDMKFSEGADDSEINYGDQKFHLGNLLASVRGVPRRKREEVVVRYFSQVLELGTSTAHR